MKKRNEKITKNERRIRKEKNREKNKKRIENIENQKEKKMHVASHRLQCASR